jgi:hypothetical protein
MRRRFSSGIIVCLALIGIVSAARAASDTLISQSPPASSSPYHDSLMKLSADYKAITDQIADTEGRVAENNPVLIPMRRRQSDLLDQLRHMSTQAVADATNDYWSKYSRLEAQRNRLREITGRTDVSAESLQATARALEEEKEALLLERAGDDAKYAAIETAVAQRTAQARQVMLDDQVITELKKVVDLRTQALKRSQDLNRTAAAIQPDIDAAEAQLADANLKLVQREEEISGSDAISSLSEKLANLIVAQKENQAKFDFISKRLKVLESPLDRIDELQRFQNELRIAAEYMNNANRDDSWVEHELRQHQPTPPTTAP